MARKPDGEEPKQTVSIKVDTKVLEAAKDLAWQAKVSFSAYVEKLLREDLKKHGKKI